MDTKNLIYPSKGFSKKVKWKLNKEEDFNIVIKSRFPKFIMSRAIDCWPRVSNDADRMKTAVNSFLSISMFFLSDSVDRKSDGSVFGLYNELFNN